MSCPVSLIERALGVWQPACVSAMVALYSLALRGSLRVLDWAAGVSLVELPLAVFFLAPIANSPSACSPARDGDGGRRHRPDAPYPPDVPDGAGGPGRPPPTGPWVISTRWTAVSGSPSTA